MVFVISRCMPPSSCARGSETLAWDKLHVCRRCFRMRPAWIAGLSLLPGVFLWPLITLALLLFHLGKGSAAYLKPWFEGASWLGKIYIRLYAKIITDKVSGGACTVTCRTNFLFTLGLSLSNHHKHFVVQIPTLVCQTWTMLITIHARYWLSPIIF